MTTEIILKQTNKQKNMPYILQTKQNNTLISTHKFLKVQFDKTFGFFNTCYFQKFHLSSFNHVDTTKLAELIQGLHFQTVRGKEKVFFFF